MKYLFRSCIAATALFMSTAALAEQPANVGDAIMKARAYHDSGVYQQDFDAVMAKARDTLIHEAPTVARPAIVLDIDETTLSNWDDIRANNFGYITGGSCDNLPKGPCGAIAWENSARAPAFAATKALIAQAKALNVAIFFVTGRHEAERAATERNLHAAGIASWSGLYLRPNDSHVLAGAYKTPVRTQIESQGYTIVENLGDQPSDLTGGHARHVFLLPNPFYRIP